MQLQHLAFTKQPDRQNPPAVCTVCMHMQITIATSLTLRVGSMAEQTFNAVERVDEYCHLPEEAAYETSQNPPKTSSGAESDPAAKRSGGGGSGGAGGSVGGAGPAAGGGGAGVRSKQRNKAGAAAGSLREPLLPVTAPDSAAGAAGRSSSSVGSRGAGGSVPAEQAGGGAVVAVNGAVPEGWPREGSIEFSDVKMRWVVFLGNLV